MFKYQRTELISVPCNVGGATALETDSTRALTQTATRTCALAHPGQRERARVPESVRTDPSLERNSDGEKRILREAS
ncbi:hypothetical protein F2P79_010967 [Pimephales promelas]|nr:hypothetical protein F2P79_010967 [Pimephales promelas]